MKAFTGESQKITTALLLAAGTGKRLKPLTDDAPKCLTKVNGKTILKRLIEGLRASGIERLVVVVGYLEHCVRDYLSKLNTGLTIDFVSNPKYDTTNNIYSLWVARSTIQEPFLLVESDLVVDAALLDGMMYPGMIGVSRILPWMNGTTVSVDPSHRATCFHMGGSSAADAVPTPDQTIYKTVNIYSLSRSAWQRVAQRLDQYVSAGRVDGYYEAVFAEMVADGSLAFDAVFFDNERWYEIDTIDDLRQAERLFAKEPSRLHRKASPKLLKLEGGLPPFNPRPIRDAAGRDKPIQGAP